MKKKIETIAAAQQYGIEKGFEMTKKGFPWYRAYSPFAILALVIYFLVVKQWNYVIFFVAIFHFHVITNQLYNELKELKNANRVC